MMIKKTTFRPPVLMLIICIVIWGLLFKLLMESSALEAANQKDPLEIDRLTAEKIGLMIYRNECSCKEKNLLFWNDKEAFPSLGIGHFVWLPANAKATYEETFPKFIRFLQSHNYIVPEWLMSAPRCPWETRTDFYTAITNNDPKMDELRTFILNTIPQQTQFIIHRFHATFNKIYNQLQGKPQAQRALYKMVQSPLGLYALIDYTNFKGSGLNPTERRNGQGYGLLQVIEKMSQKFYWLYQPEKAFSVSAIELLTLRANNSPEGKEKHFLPGWIKRCKSYTEPF